MNTKCYVRKYKPNWEIQCRPIQQQQQQQQQKTVINLELRLKNSFQEIFYRVNSWINEGSGLIIELTESQYINVSTYRPLSGIFT